MVPPGEVDLSQASFVRQPLETVIARYNRFAPWYRYLEWTILLAPAAEVIATTFPGDPYSRPWEDLMRLTPAVTTERFQGDLYFVCSAHKP